MTGRDRRRADFPTTPGAFDPTHNGAERRLRDEAQPDRRALALLDLPRRRGFDQGLGIAVDGSGAAYVTASTLTADYPTTPGAYDTTYNGERDGFVTKLTPPALAVSNAGVVEGDAGEQSAVLQVTMDLPNGSTVKVDYATEDGSAQAPGDYVATAGSVTFQPGQTSRRIEVPIADDALDERVETLRVRISNARYAPIEDAVGVVTITDDDDPPALRVNDKSITEGNAGTKIMRFFVTLEQPSGKTVQGELRDRRRHRDGARGLHAHVGHHDIRPGRHLASGRRAGRRRPRGRADRDPEAADHRHRERTAPRLARPRNDPRQRLIRRGKATPTVAPRLGPVPEFELNPAYTPTADQPTGDRPASPRASTPASSS